MKWSSFVSEIVSSGVSNQTFIFSTSMISTAITPILELHQQLIKAYANYKECGEGAADSVKTMSTTGEKL